MKQRRRLTLQQKRLVSRWGLNPEVWLRTKQPPGELHLVHRHFDHVQRIIKIRQEESA